MRATARLIWATWAIGVLGASLGALWLSHHPTFAGETPRPVSSVTKSDRLVIRPLKGNLLIVKRNPAKADRRAAVEKPVPPEVETPVPAAAERPVPAAIEKPVVELRKPAAPKLIDVAIRDDGIWLNSFATRSMPLDDLACAELSEEIISRFRFPASAVQRLAEEDLMRQTRVCAVNGSLLVTCYGGDATVSLRRPHFGDGCGG